MEKREGFYTLKGYQNGEAHNMTASMEDYLEMICRLLLTEEVVRGKPAGPHAPCQAFLCFKNGKKFKGSGISLI